jgi:hypothetical protein
MWIRRVLPSNKGPRGSLFRGFRRKPSRELKPQVAVGKRAFDGEGRWSRRGNAQVNGLVNESGALPPDSVWTSGAVTEVARPSSS